MASLALPQLLGSSLLAPDLAGFSEPVLSEQGGLALVELVREALKEEKYERRVEVREATRQRHYDRGQQFIYFDQSYGVFRPASESGKELPRYTEHYNIYAPHRRSFVSQLGQSTPGINWVPNDLQQAADLTAANRAEKLRSRLSREVKLKKIQSKIARLFCTDGRVGVWTRVEDGKLVCTVHGVLDLKLPLFTEDLSECDYAVVSRERSIARLKRLYSQIKEDIQPSTDSGEWAYERYARLGVLGGSRATYDAFKHLATEHTCWLRPERFEKAPKQVQDELNSLYPDGVRVTVVSDKLADATPESMDDHLAVGHPAPGDGQSRPSLLHDLLPIQDAFNDGMNQAREFFDYGIPALWINQSAVDAEAIPDQRSEPGVIHTAEWTMGNALSNAFFQEAPAVLPAGLMEYLTTISNDLAQFVVSDFPTNYGDQQEGGTDTFGEAKLLSDQAKGLLSPAWQGLQELHAAFEKQGVDQLAMLLQGQQVSIQNADGTSDAFQANEIMPGSYGCYADEDSSFPETMADRRAALQNVFTQIGSMQGGDSIVGQPDNLKLVKQYSGLTDLVIPAADARDKALRAIGQLLQEQPLPSDPVAMQQYQMSQSSNPDQPNAAPPPMRPSIAIDEDFDYLQESFDKVKEWLSSDSRVEEERKGNQAGIMNVRLFGLAYKDAIAKQAQAQQTQASKPISWTANLEDVAAPVQAALLQKEGLPGDPVAQQEQQGQQDAREVIKKVVK